MYTAATRASKNRTACRDLGRITPADAVAVQAGDEEMSEHITCMHDTEVASFLMEDAWNDVVHMA
jgi:hypothetical protein